MKNQHAKIERFNAFSDGIFGVLITILVLDLRPPASPTFNALSSYWPSWLSYAVSYLFVAIVWVNHHHLLRCAEMATPRLIWLNFAHLFAASLLPFSTAWIAESRLAPFPVALYAADFVLVNATYIALRHAVARQLRGIDLQMDMAPLMQVRALFTLGVFTIAMIVSLKWPWIGMGLICFCLLLYVRPDVPGIKTKTNTAAA
jgi:TMEM175 potassium channel family protein